LICCLPRCRWRGKIWSVGVALDLAAKGRQSDVAGEDDLFCMLV